MIAYTGVRYGPFLITYDPANVSKAAALKPL